MSDDIFTNKAQVTKFVRTRTNLSNEVATNFVNWFVSKCPERYKVWEKIALLIDLSQMFAKGDLILEGEDMQHIKVVPHDALLTKYGLTLISNGPVTITNKEVYKFPE